MHNRVAPAVVVSFLSLIAPSAQTRKPPSVEDVLDRMGAYLEAYESQLTAITADERYEQREVLLKEERVMSSRVEMPIPGRTGALMRMSRSSGFPGAKFDRDRRLDALVPVEMTEIFDVFGGRGEGKATYTNFKRFERRNLVNRIGNR